MQLGHRIRRLHWQVRSDRNDAFRLRQVVRDSWQDEISGYLQNAFDAIANEDEIVHIPRLQLHIQVNSNKDFTDIFAQQLHKQIRDQLSLTGLVARQHPTVEKGLVAATEVTYLLEYLQSGHLPWPLRQSEAPSCVQYCRKILQEHRQTVLNQTFSETYPEAYYFRLFQLLAEQSREVLQEFWLPSLADIPQRFMTRFITYVFSSRPTAPLHIESLLLAKLVVILKSAITLPSPQEVNHVLPVSVQHLWREVLLHIATSEGEAGIAQTDIAPMASSQARQTAQALVDTKRATSETAIASDRLNDLEAAAGSDKLIHKFPDTDTLLPGLETCLVHAAGLVLLYPYLGRLFDSVGIITERNNSIAETQLPHAAAVLHYLVSGREDIHEFDLDLIKVMLGLTPSQTLLVGRGLLPKTDKDEADNLLKAVISHWTVLKATSVQGLRQSFLQRSGILRESDYNFVLQVERKGHDILLDFLPWGYSLIKLPWMTKALFTEW